MRRMFSENQIKGLAVAGINEATEAGQEVKIDIANLVDADGHNRFIEGDISLIDNPPAGITLTYAKWSLSGSHLLIVLAGTIANGSTLSFGKIAVIGVPEWVADKVYPIANNYVDSKTITTYDDAYSTTQSLGTFLRKISDEISVYVASFTATNDRNFRIAFDLLIDNE